MTEEHYDKVVVEQLAHLIVSPFLFHHFDKQVNTLVVDLLQQLARICAIGASTKGKEAIIEEERDTQFNNTECAEAVGKISNGSTLSYGLTPTLGVQEEERINYGPGSGRAGEISRCRTEAEVFLSAGVIPSSHAFTLFQQPSFIHYLFFLRWRDGRENSLYGFQSKSSGSSFLVAN